MSYRHDYKPYYGDKFFKNTLNYIFFNINIIWFFWFLICLYPVNIADFGINYLFILTPLFYLLSGGRLYQLIGILKILATSATLIFLLAIIYQIEFYDQFFRRFISFILFMSIFSLAVIKLKLREFNSILLAIITASCAISAISIFNLFSLGLIENAHEAKDGVGSQRYGFMLVFSFWAILWPLKSKRYLFKISILALATLLLCGIFLTFSRSSIVSLVGSSLIFMMTKDNRISVLGLFKPHKIVLASFFIALIFFIGEYFLPSMKEFFDERLFDIFASGKVFDSLSNPETSEGTRIRIWTDIIEYVFQNPFTGSGFLGSWAIVEGTGSAHNQYLDMFLRMGIFGFTIYIALLWRICCTLLKRNRFLFCGFFGVLIYGIFHETFKEPNGALLLAFLASYYSVNRKLIN